MTFDLLKLELYAQDASGRIGLKGGSCSACGHVFFPMQTRGCERCGAHGTALTETELGATGKLISAATVHFHAGKTRTAPFVIGVIDLDAGPRVRTLLEDMPDADSRSGARMKATLVDAPGYDDKLARDLRFRPE